MSKIKHKMSDEILKDLLQKSRELPTVCRMGPDGNPMVKKVQVPGHKLTQADMPPGHTLNEKLVYSVAKYADVDHYTTMIEIYREKGQEGIDDYVTATMALKKFTMNKLNKSWWERAIDWVANKIK